MELQKAIEQVSAIHDQVSKTEFYQGFRALPVAITGGSAFLCALVQPWVLGSTPAPTGFTMFWLFIAIVNALFITVFLGYRYLYQETPLERRKSRHMLMQFGPAVVGGGVLTLILCHAESALLIYMPGLWTLIFAMGIFASRPYLPPKIFWVGCFYLSASILLILLGTNGSSLNPWGMGLTFGIGQWLVAAVFYWDLERTDRLKQLP